jgi:hypothetical protein
VAADRVARFTDEGLLVHLDTPALVPEARTLLDGIRVRRLHKRAYECPAATLGDDVGEWISSDYTLTRRVEDAFARELQLPQGAVLLDYPAKTQMLGVDIPMQRRDGRVVQLTADGWEGALNLPRLSDELYRSARRLRVLTANRAPVPSERVLSVLRMDAAEVRARLDAGGALLV